MSLSIEERYYRLRDTTHVVRPDDMTVYILPDPTATISVTGASTICENNSSEITITGTPETTVTYNICSEDK